MAKTGNNSALCAHLLLADGFEEIEAIAVIDILRRAQIQTTLFGVAKREIISTRNVHIMADLVLTTIPAELPDIVILPGGEPGTTNLEKSPIVQAILQRQYIQKKWTAAICAAPRILNNLGFLEHHRATSFPAVAKHMTNCLYSEDAVVVDHPFITSRGAGTALAFAYAIVSTLKGSACAEQLQTDMVYSH
jgi:protein deglycase